MGLLRNNQIQEALAKCFLGSIAIKMLRGFVPVERFALGIIALYSYRFDGIEKIFEALFAFFEGFFGSFALVYVLESSIKAHATPFFKLCFGHHPHPAFTAFGGNNLELIIKALARLQGSLHKTNYFFATFSFFIKGQALLHIGHKIVGYFVDFARYSRPLIGIRH